MEKGKRILTPEEMEQVSGGTDYSYAYEVIGQIATRYQALMNDGLPIEQARATVKKEYWDEVVEICQQHPDDCGIQKQTEIIFLFVLGG